MNQSFFNRTSLRFYSRLAILQPQIYVVVEKFGAEKISLLSGRLVIQSKLKTQKVWYFTRACESF